MTGQKNRFKTTEKLWNLDDKQLKTPKHDAMVLWLMDESNLVKVFQIENKCEWTDYVMIDYNTEKRVTVVGDLEEIRIQSEVPIMSSPTFIAGYGDLVVEWVYEGTYNGKTYRCYSSKRLIEVKPHIDSFGAVLRQIKSYKEFSGCREYYLFTLDDRFDSQFESQDIHVLHPPNDVSIDDMIGEFL